MRTPPWLEPEDSGNACTCGADVGHDTSLVDRCMTCGDLICDECSRIHESHRECVGEDEYEAALAADIEADRQRRLTIFHALSDLTRSVL